MVVVSIVLLVKGGIEVEVVLVTIESCYVRKIIAAPSCSLYSFPGARDGLF